MRHHPRLGTPAGDRAMASAQRSYDNLTPEDVYGPDEPEPEEDEEVGEEPALVPILNAKGEIVGFKREGAK